MTITRTIRKRLRRYALYCLMAAASAGTAGHAGKIYASDTHDSSSLCGWVDECSRNEVTPITRDKHSVSAEDDIHFFAVDLSDTLEIDTCKYDAWLRSTLEPATIAAAGHPVSGTVSVVADAETTLADDHAEPTATFLGHADENHSSPVASSRTSTAFNQTMAAIAAAASAGNPLPFGHWTEPFAMVGPGGSHSVPEIESFQEWFKKGQEVAKTIADADSKSVDEQIVAIESSEDYAAEDFAADERIADVSIDDFVPVVDFDGEIGVMEMVETTTVETPESSLAAQAFTVDRSSFVGASPVIATIEEAYAPYDLVESDRNQDAVEDPAEAVPTPTVPTPTVQREDPPLVWADGVLPSIGHPFCIRSLPEFRQPGWSPLQATGPGDYLKTDRQETTRTIAETVPDAQPTEPTTAVDHIAVVDPIGPVETEIVVSNTEPESIETDDSSELEIARRKEAARWEGSADCLLDEFIWSVGNALEEESVTDQWLRPKWIGEHVATLVVSSDAFASRVAGELALVWPARAQPAKPIPGAGAQLLARAEATESGDSVKPKAAERTQEEGSDEPPQSDTLAQATATLLQWVDATQSVIEDVSDRFDDVIEVARNRGTQDDSKKR